MLMLLVAGFLIPLIYNIRQTLSSFLMLKSFPLISNHPMGNKDTKTEEKEEVKTQKKVTKINGESQLINSKVVEQMKKHLPKEHREADWNLSYSTKTKGKNIQLFHQCLHGKGANLMFIKSTTSNHIFGAYASQGWKLSTDFYGDSSTFLFSFSKEEEKLYTYKPASYNNNFQYFNYGSKWNKFNGIGIGGLMKHFQLSIDEEFLVGKTMPRLMTFPNCPTLCHASSASDSPDENANPNFEIETFEVFTFPLTEQQILDLEYEKQNKDARLGEIDVDINKFILESAGVTKDEAREDAF
jgi:hypothetical protein